MFSNPKSFPIAVNAEDSLARLIAENPFLFFSYLPTISEDRCIESAAEPPFPHVKQFFIY